MRKFLVTLAAFLFIAPAASAQIKYQGHLGAGYSIGIGQSNANVVNVETSHGVRLNPYVFVGLGGGIDYRSAWQSFNSHFYATGRGYLLDKPVTPFLSMDLGYGIFSNGGGLYASPGVGVQLRLGSHYALAFSTGLQTQGASDTKSEGAKVVKYKWTDKNIFFRVELMF